MSKAKSNGRPNQTDPNQTEPDQTEHMAASATTARGYLTGPGLVEFPVEYAVVDGTAIYQGCIDMGPAEQVAAEAAVSDEVHHVLTTTAAAGADASLRPEEVMGVGLPTDSTFLWTGGRVAWTVDAGVPNQTRITDAVAHIEQNTGIRFVRRTSANASTLPNWINIVSNGSATFSSSKIGMRGGEQTLRLADSHPWPILVHEFLHALGVYHEQSRSDRDTFVEVKWSNIKDGPPPDGEINALGNFQKQPGSTDYFDYDYGSLMHYGPRNFAKDSSQPTLVPKQSGVTIGQRDGMSFGDRQTVAKMYERFFTKGYSGVWREGSGAYALWANAEWENFRAKWEEWSGRGLRLVDIHVRQTNAGPRYSGVFLPGAGGHALWVGATWDSFRAKWQEWSGQGLRLHDLHVHSVNGENRFSGVFLPGNGGHGLWVGATWDSFRTQWQQWSAQGLRLHDLHVHSVNGAERFSGVFLPGTGGHGLWVGASWASFVAKWQEWSRQGLRLVDLNTHRAGAETRFSGVFLPGNDGHYLWANVTWESFRAKWQELAGQGLRLIDVEFVNAPAGQLFDEADATAADVAMTEEVLEPFGGIFDAAVPQQRPAVTPALEPAEVGRGGLMTGDATIAAAADGDGALVLSGANAPSSQGSDAGQSGDGGVVLDVRSPEDRGSDAGTGDAVLPDAVPATSGRR